MVSPLDALSRFMEAESGVPCATTASALVLAARALGLCRVAVATPYDERMNRHEAAYLESHGLDVVSIRGLGIGADGPHEYVRIARVPEARVFEHVVATWDEAAEGMIVSCTDFPTLGSIATLEARFGRPVIPSNTATLWRCLRLAGLDARIAIGGRLFLQA
jgi:maleate isomerase/arylmalonate decarboxylase